MEHKKDNTASKRSSRILSVMFTVCIGLAMFIIAYTSTKH